MPRATKVSVGGIGHQHSVIITLALTVGFADNGFIGRRAIAIGVQAAKDREPRRGDHFGGIDTCDSVPGQTRRHCRQLMLASLDASKQFSC